MSADVPLLAPNAAVETKEGDDPDVADLVWRLRAGERSAIAEAYDRHGSALRAFSRRLLGDAAAAEDLVHDVFLALPKTVRRFEGRCSLRTFLISVAANRCRHHVRSAARYRRAKQRYAAEQLASTPPGPGALHALGETADRLARALDGLPLEQRLAFVLSVVEGRPNAEVARILSVAEGTVRTRVMRARRRLKKVLAEESGDA